MTIYNCHIIIIINCFCRTAVDHHGFPEHFEKMLYHFPLKQLPHVKTGVVEGDTAAAEQEESGMNPTAGETGKEEEEAGVSMETGSTEEEAGAAEVSEKLESDESDPSSEPPTKVGNHCKY